MPKAKIQPSEELKDIIADPLDDLEIRHYLPHAKIITYNELSRYKSINQLLPGETDYVIILLDEAPMLNTINLIYTAITRAKKKCILISQEKTVKSIKKRTERRNFCRLF